MNLTYKRATLEDIDILVKNKNRGIKKPLINFALILIWVK